jgi:hypothetical protein
MDAATAALSEACGGQPYFWNHGTDARIVAARSHESSVIVSVHVTRIAHVAADLRAALIAEAPAIARRRRNDAAEKREKARVLIAEACALEDAAQRIDAALAAMVTT